MNQMNALIGESSPYLLQHAHNPVDWHPWGEAAFARARGEEKPIFLSVGYSTCHWCHVMERESFANPAIAALLNRHFVSIKVDREERPDVDRVYMTYVQATTGGGGWPMSVWLTPDLTPFVGGTYFPPEDRWGRPGLRSVLWQIAEAWRQDRAALVTAGNAILSRLRDAVAPAAPTRDGLGPGCLVRTCQALRASYDPVEGGFGGAPKFPRPSAPAFLLRHYARTGEQDALDMATLTLRRMAMGGMYDHLGGGFHRYSVDARWHVPHFEKMLYDQAQLACLYLDAFQITRDPFLARVARGVLDYVRRDLTGEDGQFNSAEDADSSRPEAPSQHAEGAFYVWTWGEIVGALGPEKAAVFAFAYGVEPEGNVRDDPHHEFRGRNILFMAQPTAAVAARFGLTDEQADRTLAAARECLFAARSGRPRPHLDDQAITAWNGLMISALARASQVLDADEDLNAARRAADFLRERVYDASRGVLLRRYREGKAAIEGYADDYAFLIQGLIDLYEACFDVGYLEWAMALQESQDACFRDGVNGGYFCTSGRDPAILLRLKEGYDGAEPSANSVAALNLLRLADLLDRPDLRERALQTMAAFGGMLGRAPDAMPQMAAALAYSLDPPSHIVVAGRAGADDTQALLRVVHGGFRPHTRLVLADGGSGQERHARHLGILRGLGMVQGRAAAYVCADGTCRPPTTDPERLRRELARMP